MIIKVCGLKKEDQIKELDQLPSVNWLGSIFYEKSKRFVESSSSNIVKSKKVGVFVNETIDNTLEIAKKNNLDILQLHGSESSIMCFELKKSYTVIKAFGVDDNFDFGQLKQFEKSVDYFLFDTKTINHGGSGKQFNWQVLEKYKLEIPFLLSGGINLNSVQEIKEIKHPAFVGIDLNSGFENIPGDKNIDKIKRFIEQLEKTNSSMKYY